MKVKIKDKCSLDNICNYIIYLCFSFLLSTLLTSPSAYAQQSSKLEFLEDARFSKNILIKISKAKTEQAGKTIPELQILCKLLKEDQAINFPAQKPRKTKKMLPSDLYEMNKSAVFILGRYNQQNPQRLGSPQAMATAFAISDDGICVTNYHVLRELLTTNLSIDSLENQRDESMYYIQDFQGDVYIIEKVLAYSTTNDIAIFKINSPQHKLAYFDLAEIAKVGSSVYVISHPEQEYYYLSEGIVTKNSLLVDPRNPTRKKYRMTISADYAVGSSGGPIFNIDGALVGLVSSTRNIFTGSNNQGFLQLVLKNAISVYALKKLLNQ